MKRYAIVSVDNHCPDGSILIRRCLYTDIQCKDCYGDTKEQLVLKITQVLRTKRALFGITDKQLAKEIVEFLGVEE